jgi:hypothetical protein
VTGSAIPASRFGSVPVFPAHRRPRTVIRSRASLNLAGPSRARRRTDAGRFSGQPRPPGLCAPTAHEVKRVRFHGLSKARHLPSSAFRTLSTVSTPPHRPGLFHPGNAHGVPPSGLRSSPGSRTSFEALPALLPFTSRPQPLSRRREARLQSFALPRESVPRRSENARGRCPPGVLPSKALSLPGVRLGPDPRR